ncbi:MAG: YcxB family protein [Saprospiraceae bacterium]
MIEVRYQISFRDYLRLMFQLAYRRWTYLVITILGALQIPFIIAMYIVPGAYQPGNLLSSFLLIVFAFLMPLLLYFRSRNFYLSNASFRQEIKAIFNTEAIEFTGFGKRQTSRLTWDRIQKVLETRDWLVFYQTPYFFNFVPKNSFTSPRDLEQLVKIIRSKPNVKAKLKNR